MSLSVLVAVTTVAALPVAVAALMSAWRTTARHAAELRKARTPKHLSIDVSYDQGRPTRIDFDASPASAADVELVVRRVRAAKRAAKDAKPRPAHSAAGRH